MMLILGLLGMYFDAAVVFVTNSSLLLRLAVAILWCRVQCTVRGQNHGATISMAFYSVGT